MAALRRCCDLPPFRLFSSRLVFQEPTFEASSTGFLGLCLCAFFGLIALLSPVAVYDSSKLTVLRFSKTAFGDDAQGSVLSADLVGIIGGSIRCFAHPDAVASIWFAHSSVVALMLICRSSSSSCSRVAVNSFPSSCLPLLVRRSSYL
ncbi:Uncharacterized protein Rs2_26589 [Raphanus sativus]|nr:Uncharacterized protein Rs2_26589 [Raphanus sativus]